jgi:hypothetical protein
MSNVESGGCDDSMVNGREWRVAGDLTTDYTDGTDKEAIN